MVLRSKAKQNSVPECAVCDILSPEIPGESEANNKTMNPEYK